MGKLSIKANLNSKELNEFFAHWPDSLFSDKQEINSWDSPICGHNREVKLSEHIYVRICDGFKKNSVDVYESHGIKLGEFQPDNGWHGGDNYYPIVRFYNQLNYSGFNGGVYNVGRVNNYDAGKIVNDVFTLTTEDMLDTIRKSYEYLKIFED